MVTFVGWAKAPERSSRPGTTLRAVPTMMRRTIKDLKRQAAKGVKITRRSAGRAAARQVRRVLGSHKASTAAVVRNLRVSRAYKRRRRVRQGNTGIVLYWSSLEVHLSAKFEGVLAMHPAVGIAFRQALHHRIGWEGVSEAGKIREGQRRRAKVDG